MISIYEIGTEQSDLVVCNALGTIIFSQYFQVTSLYLGRPVKYSVEVISNGILFENLENNKLNKNSVNYLTN